MRALLARPFPRARPSAVATPDDVRLELQPPRGALDVGDALMVSLAVHNASSAPVTFAQPECASTIYALELVDDTGEVVPSALGWREDPLCAPEDMRPVEVEPGSSTTLDVRLPSLEVLASARPGRYRARVRYRFEGLGPTAMELVSNEVPVVIEGGDARLWQCRRDQLDAVDHYRRVSNDHPTLVLADPADPAAGVFAIYWQDGLGDGVSSSVRLVRVDGGGVRAREAVWSVRAVTSRHVSAARTPAGLVVAAERRHGELHLGLVSVARDLSLQVRAPREIGPTYPEFHALAAHGDRVALVYGDVLDAPMRLAQLDARGAARGAPRPVARRVAPEMTGRTVSLDAEGGWIVWAPRRGGLRARRLDRDGALAEPIGVPLDGVPIAVHGDARTVDIAFFDNRSSPNDPMGLRGVRLGRDGVVVGDGRAYGPLGNDIAGGAVAWGRSSVAALRLWRGGDDGMRSELRVGASAHALGSWTGRVDVIAWGDGFAAAWADGRNDTGIECTQRNMCATEIYVAFFDRAGAPIGDAVRATDDAQAGAPGVRPHGWEAQCPP